MKRFILIITIVFCALLVSCANREGGTETETKNETKTEIITEIGAAEDNESVVNIVNRTGLTVDKLFLVVGNSETLGDNRLEKPLADGDSAIVNMGKLTDEELEYGFRIQVCNGKGDYIYGEELGRDFIFFDSGSFIVLLTPESGDILDIADSYNADKY